MDTVIGLGSAGRKIADEFLKYPQYDVYKIDVGCKGENCFDFQKQNSPEDYERNCPDMGDFFSTVSGDVLFILAGGGKISGATLSILKQIKNSNISVLYIQPDKDDLTSIGFLQHRLTFHVLQEYARSGLLDKIYLVSNTILEDVIGDVPLLQHDKKINEFIVSTIHYLNVFKNTESVYDNYEPPSLVSRIATFGVLDLKDGSEKYFFNLLNEKDKEYYFAYPESTLNTDGKLLKNIRDSVNKNTVKASYRIYSTKHQTPFCYFVSFSNVIQALDT